MCNCLSVNYTQNSDIISMSRLDFGIIAAFLSRTEKSDYTVSVKFDFHH